MFNHHLTVAAAALAMITSPAIVAAPKQPAQEQPAQEQPAQNQPTTEAQADAARAPAPEAVDPKRCELHVWGGERFQAVTTTLLSGFGLVGGLIDAARNAENNRLNQSRLGSALDTQGQAAALASLDLPKTLGIANYAVVTHDEPMDPKVAGQKRRHAASSSPCYAELMVTRVLYQKAPLYGRSLRASFLYRQFGADTKPSFSFAGRGGNGLSVFPAKDEAQVDAANAEIVSVFKANFQEYANNLLKRRGRSNNRS